MDSDLNIRVSTDDDDAAELRRLAALDRAELPYGPVMLAELDGEPVAAMGIADGKTVADRSRAASWVMAMLSLRRLETRAIIAVFGA
jgi:hypothetical protein